MKKLLLGFLSLLIVFSFERTVKAEVYGNISGKVITDTGVPVGGVKLELTNYKDFLERMEFNEAKKEIVYWDLVTDKNGFYVFKGITPGKYYLNINMKSFVNNYSLYKQSAPTMPVELLQGQNLVDLNIIISRYFGTISGKVLKSDGITPYPNVGVKVLKTDKESLSVGTDSNGVFEFKKYTPTSGECRIMIKSYDTSTADYYFVPNNVIDLSEARDITDLNIVAEEMPPTGFFGVVKNIDDTIFSNGVITVKSIKWKAFYAIGPINAEGRYEFQGLIPGVYKFEICSSTSEKSVIKLMTTDSTFSIDSVGEKKEINLIYDDKKSIRKEIRLKAF